MRTIVDTSVWSLAFRKKELMPPEDEIVRLLSELIRELHVVMLGPIRQEILTGIHDPNRFEIFRERLSIFVDFQIETIDYETAATFHNRCRANGIQGSHIDFLICAVAVNRNYPILTLDKDFRRYRDFINISLL